MAFSLFKQAKRFGKPKSIVTDLLPPVKNTFEKSTHIVVKDFDDDISNNLVEPFKKTFKSWYKKTKGFKGLIALLITLFFTTILLNLIHHLKI